MNAPKSPRNNSLLVKYTGLAFQMIAGLALAVWIGLKADKWFSTSMPLLVWALPLLVIVGIMYQVIKDTSNKKNV